TFGDTSLSLEVYLFDASPDLYDSYVRIDFVARLRDTRKFDGPAALVAQLARDEDAARRALTAKA
ncbi:MAG: riboflavin kinase, partial [Gemmatimonadota bacterium]|nr:riboflavin kinase [Gemmatimonadota bacterium]